MDSIQTILCIVSKQNSLLSTSPIVVSYQQMLTLFLRQKYYFHVKMLAICNPMNQIVSKIFLNQHTPLVCQQQK